MQMGWPEWDTITWYDRIEILKKRFAGGRSTILAKQMGIALNTIKNWQRGVCSPSKAWEAALKDMYERDSVKDLRMASYTLFNSAVVDPVMTVIDGAIAAGDTVTIQMAVYAIVAKIAAVLKSTNHGDRLLVQTSAIIDLPASAMCEITDITRQLVGYVATVRVMQSKELDSTFYIAMELKKPGTPITRAAYKLADVAFDTIIRRILNFFYGKKYKPKRAYRT